METKDFLTYKLGFYKKAKEVFSKDSIVDKYGYRTYKPDDVTIYYIKGLCQLLTVYSYHNKTLSYFSDIINQGIEINQEIESAVKEADDRMVYFVNNDIRLEFINKIISETEKQLSEP